MRELRWQILIALGGIALILALFLGQNPIPESVPPQPVVGGAYSEALVGTPIRLNPILDSFNQVDRDIDRLLYSGLTRFDARGNPQPELARVAVSADATLYTFSLREDAVWHDGEPVTSDDVIYTFSKFQDEDFPGPEDLKVFWEQVNLVRLDERTVQFQLAEPFAPFLDFTTVGLLPDHLLRGVTIRELVDHPFNLNPIGTGPFRFSRFLVESGVIKGVSLEAFEDFYGQRPFLERFEFRFYDDPAAALRAFQAGDVQGIGNVQLPILEATLQEPGLNVFSARLARTAVIFLNTKHPEVTELGEKTFRQALSSAINRQWVIDTTLQGQAMIAASPILSGTWAYADDLEPPDFAPDLASNLLLDLGWELPLGASPGTEEFVRLSEDQALTLELLYPDDPVFEGIARAVEANWKSVGIRVELIPVEPESLLEDYLEPRDYQAALTELNLARSPDPDPYPFWHDSQSEAGQNFSAFTDRNISIWLERARTNPVHAERADLYRNFQFRFQDQVPAILLYHPIYTFAIGADVQGVSIGPLFDPSDRFATVTGWHLLARRTLVTETPADSATAVQ